MVANSLYISDQYLSSSFIGDAENVNHAPIHTSALGHNCTCHKVKLKGPFGLTEPFPSLVSNMLILNTYLHKSKVLTGLVVLMYNGSYYQCTIKTKTKVMVQNQG